MFWYVKINVYLCIRKTTKKEIKEMRVYQQEICSAVINKRDWMGSNVEVVTKGNVTKVRYYWTTIAVVNHNTRSAKLDNGGYTNAATAARINAVKEACNHLGYSY